MILCERAARWKTAIAVTDGSCVTRLCRTLEECAAELDIRPASLVALEATAGNFAQIVNWLTRLETRWPEARGIVLASAELSPYEAVLREAGAVLVVDSVLQTRRVCQLASCYAARLERTTTVSEKSFFQSASGKP